MQLFSVGRIEQRYIAVNDVVQHIRFSRNIQPGAPDVTNRVGMFQLNLCESGLRSEEGEQERIDFFHGT